MTKRTDNEIVKVSGVDPAILAKYGEINTFKGMEEYVILSYMKMVQPTSDSVIKDRFGEGTLILRPGDAVITRSAKSTEHLEDAREFEFNPHFFWVQYDHYSDLKDTDSRVILETTFDSKHTIAVKARDPEQRNEIYPGHESKKKPWQYRFVESLNFVGEICGDHELAGTACVLRFQRGEYGVGKGFISATTQRRMSIPGPEGLEDPVRVNCPLFAQRWTFTPGWREPDAEKKWWGLDYIAASQPQIDDDDFERCGEAHLEYKRLHEADILRIDSTENGDAESNEDVEAAEKFE